MSEQIVISAPSIKRARFTIQGSAPLMTARFAKKALLMAGPSKAGTKVKNITTDWEAEWQDAAYVSHEGWYGVNASAFRNASISACRLVGFKMTIAKLSVFVRADGFDANDSVPLVRITQGMPQASYMQARNSNGSTSIRARPLWAPGWQMQPIIEWDDKQFGLQDITNLMARVGMQVGIGEGRPDSRQSAGLGYGLFDIIGVDMFE